jgi:hypothetical protein
MAIEAYSMQSTSDQQQHRGKSSDLVRVGNVQHCVVISFPTVELNLPSGSTLVLHDVRHIPHQLGGTT